MDNVDPLAQLKDLHLPEAISWWPLAPGWYVVLLLSVLVLLGLNYSLKKRENRFKAKNQALALLDSYQKEFELNCNAQTCSAQISELLRRVALVYFPRAMVASLHGQAWINFLNQTSKGIDFNPVQSLLLESPFKTPREEDLIPLINRTRAWIKQRGLACSN